MLDYCDASVPYLAIVSLVANGNRADAEQDQWSSVRWNQEGLELFCASIPGGVGVIDRL